LMLDHERNGASHNNKQLQKHNNFDGNPDENTDIAEDMRIPSKICGMLIGGGGQRVKELMQETGCEIWVDWDKSSHIEAGVSTVHLKGTRYNVEDAKFKILEIKKLFEKGSNNFRFEIPAYCSKQLFGEKGKILQQLQKQYNVSINVKNYRHDNRRSIRVGDEDQKIQRTMMIILVGEEMCQRACKKGIDRIVGMFRKCQECKYLTKEEDGYAEGDGYAWFCQRCWDEFNGVVKDDDDVKGMTNQMDNVQLGSNYNRQQRPQQQHARQQPQLQSGYNDDKSGKRKVGTYNDYHHGSQSHGGGQQQQQPRYSKNKW